MVLKVYFDGANKADLKRYDRVVLAAVLGTSDQWDRFTADWKMVLETHNVQYLHTTDAVSLNKPFSQEGGWNDVSVDNLILDCVRVVRRHIAMPPSCPTGEYKPGLQVVTMTIYLEDYKRAREKKPEMPESVYEICTSEVLGFVFRRGSEIGAKCYHLYFDRGEDFYGHVRNRKDSKRIRGDVPLLNKLDLTEAEMHQTPGLQLADLFAWCISHNDVISKRLWHRALNDLPIDPSWKSVYMDEGYLLKPTPGALERTKDWRMPRRTPKP